MSKADPILLPLSQSQMHDQQILLKRGFIKDLADGLGSIQTLCFVAISVYLVLFVAEIYRGNVDQFSGFMYLATLGVFGWIFSTLRTDRGMLRTTRHIPPVSDALLAAIETAAIANMTVKPKASSRKPQA